MVVDGRGRLTYANRSARRLLCADGRRLGEPLRPEVLDIVDSVLADGGHDQRPCAIPAAREEPRYRGRAWVLGASSVALMLHAEARRAGEASKIAGELDIELPLAELAIQVSRGLTNVEIARQLRVPESTVKGRLFELYRRLGVRRRAELAALVTTRLAEPGASSESR